MSIYEIPGIVKFALPLAVTPTNIMHAFKKTGICPFNPSIFTDEDFAPSFVTDRPMGAGTDPETISSVAEAPVQNVDPQPGPSNVPNIPDILDSVEAENQPGTSTSNQNEPISTCETEVSSRFSPEIIKPFPKAPPRLQTATKRRIRKSAVLTNTPEKDALAQEQSKKKKTAKNGSNEPEKKEKGSKGKGLKTK